MDKKRIKMRWIKIGTIRILPSKQIRSVLGLEQSGEKNL